MEETVYFRRLPRSKYGSESGEYRTLEDTPQPASIRSARFLAFAALAGIGNVRI